MAGFPLERELEQEFAEVDLPHRLWQHEWESSPAACPRSSAITVSGFPRYSNAAVSLPPREQAKLKAIAVEIVRSFRPGCRPVRAVRLTGHADRDFQRGPVFEQQISLQRAVNLQLTVQALVTPALAARILWLPGGDGASRLLVPNPVTEQQRARNRRVHIQLSTDDRAGEFPILVHHPDSGYYWTVRSLGGTTLAAGTTESELNLFTQPTPVLNSSAAPYKWICSLEVDFGPEITPAGVVTGRNVGTKGTGVLISPRHVLTAGHCLFTQGPARKDIFGNLIIDIRKAQSAAVVPARDGGKVPAVEPLGKITAISLFRTSQKWESSNATDRAFDFGLITLTNPVNPDFWAQSNTGSLIQGIVPAGLKDRIGHTSGYPGQFCPPPDPQVTVACTDATRGTVQFRMTGKITNATSGRIESELNIAGGHSGSPVWLLEKTGMVMVGIASASSASSPGIAVRIRDEVLAEVRGWMVRDGVRPSF